MPKFEEFIKGFSSALENKGFKVGDILVDKQGAKYRALDPNEDKAGAKDWSNSHILAQKIDDKGEDVVSEYGNHGWFPADMMSLSKDTKARRVIDESNDYPPYFFQEKDGKFFLKGMDGEQDKELSIDDLADIYDKRNK